jgi:HPt (histidine-containing phosphotransfer) domain-containing protein
MDGYQAKPARLDDLHRALVRWVGAGMVPRTLANNEMSPLPAPQLPATSPLLTKPMLSMMKLAAADAPLTDPYLWAKLRSETAQTDPRLLEELMADLRQQETENLDELDESLRMVDFEHLRSAAHRLKGSAGMLGLPRLSACAKCVEFAAKAQDQEVAEVVLDDLRVAYAKTLGDPAVQALC